VAYDQTGNLWYGSSTTVTNRSGTTSQAVNGAALAIVSDQNNNIFVGGSFTTPQADIMVYNGTSWGAIFLVSGTPINGTVRAMAFDNAGALYIGGDFTTPQTHIIKYVYTTYGSTGSWVSIGAIAGGNVQAIVCGQDGNMYFGTSNSLVLKWDGTSLTTVGTANAKVDSLALLPDGRIIAGGLFTTMTGATGGAVAAAGVAVYNYTGWQQLGNGLGPSGTVEVTGLAVNKTTGDVYATGYFNLSSAVPLTFGFARFNGSIWIFGDATNTFSTQGKGAIALRSSDGEIALASDVVNSDLTNSALNSLNYTGTADVFPQIKITGPGTLWSITNYTTGKTIYFNNYTLLAGRWRLSPTTRPAASLSHLLFTATF
jgi:hypothetical protein